ncbi:MAG: hypothetical protein ACK5MP_11245 [Nostocoides sp.]
MGARHIAVSYTGSVTPLLEALLPLRPAAIAARPADLDELFRRLYGQDGGSDKR